MNKNVKRMLCAVAVMSAISTIPAGAYYEPFTNDVKQVSDEAVSPYITGNKYSVTGRAYVDFTIRSTKPCTKIWVNCQTGDGIQIKITDEDGNIIQGTDITTLEPSESGTLFYITRPDGYDGYYKLCIKGLNGSNASGWYNYTQGDSMNELRIVDLSVH